MFLLAGDGTVPSSAEVEVPIMDDLAVFTGGFVLDTDRAWNQGAYLHPNPGCRASRCVA